MAPAAWGQRDPDLMRDRGRRLLNRIHAGEPIRVVAFGDSLTDGWGTDGWNVYHRLVVQGLEYCCPGSPLELLVHGHPGETTADALRRVGEEVLQARPDLVFVQFGGNDRGTGRSVDAFARDLRELLARIRDETKAVVLACLPPMVDPDPRNAWNEAARAAAAAEGLPAADLDRALRLGDGDCRGPFPYGSHPGSFTHVIFAREVARALRAALGVTPALEWRVLTGSRLSAEATYPVEIGALNTSDATFEACFRFEHGDQCVEQRVKFSAQQAHRLRHEVPLPRFPGRSVSLPVRLSVQETAPWAVEAMWLTVAPAIRADVPVEAAADANAWTWHAFTPEAFTIGRDEWLGPADLSARFAVVVQPDRLVCTVEVTDDSLTTASLQDPSRGDSVEIYLDLRPDADQGKPVYGPEVVLIQVIPPTAGRGFQWRSMEPLPGDMKGLGVDCTLTPTGYAAVLSLPLSTLRRFRGPVWDGFGFDVGVNDADHGGTRKSQMMWAGTGDNYLNPSHLAGVHTRPLSPHATRQALH
ncbi:MAG: hypothetical protein HPY69_11550 [Armatimonadetes bacterium]|nr:hypothetical protein [Armatimonadota bacterium]